MIINISVYSTKRCANELQNFNSTKQNCQARVQVTPGQLQKTPSQNSRDLDLELEAIIAIFSRKSDSRDSVVCSLVS